MPIMMPDVMPVLAIFYMGINVGALLAPFVVSAVKNYFNDSYHAGFAVPALGMVIALFLFIKGRKYLPDTVDDVLGAEKAARHIQELGARNCAFVMGPENNVATKDRLIGYRNVLREDYSADKVYFGGWSSRSGRVLAEGIFRENPQVEAIFCGSDRIARGVIETALAWGRKVGEDLLVIGFDNHPFTTRTNPTITTVAHPFYK